MKRYLFHFICYYAAWLSSILFAQKGHPWGGPIVICLITMIQLAFLYKKVNWKIIPFTLIVTTLGFTIDSWLIVTNHINLLANPFKPLSSPWMIGLWINFSIIFYDCLNKYFQHYLVFALLALIGFPIAYYAGVAFRAATLPLGHMTLLYLALTWAVILPIVCYCFHLWQKN